MTICGELGNLKAQFDKHPVYLGFHGNSVKSTCLSAYFSGGSGKLKQRISGFIVSSGEAIGLLRTSSQPPGKWPSNSPGHLSYWVLKWDLRKLRVRLRKIKNSSVETVDRKCGRMCASWGNREALLVLGSAAPPQELEGSACSPLLFSFGLYKFFLFHWG